MSDSNKVSSSMAAGGGDGGGDLPAPQLQADNIEEDNSPLTDDELLELSCHINSLPGPHLGKIIEVIQSREPEKTTENNEFELDFYKLRPSTLRALQRYVAPLFNNQ